MVVDRTGDKTALNDAALALIGAGRPDLAVHLLAEAHTIDPENLDALLNLGAVLIDLGEYEQSLPLAIRANELLQNASSASNLGICYFRVAEFAKAIQCYQQSLQTVDNAVVRYNMAIAMLSNGDYFEGWRKMEERKRTTKWQTTFGRQLPEILEWNGEPISGPLLVYHEQGYGDTLMLSRFLPQLKALCDEVVVLCPAQLKALLSHSFEVRCFSDLSELPEIAQKVSFFTLPALRGVAIDNIVSNLPYLRPSYNWNTDSIEEKFKIGLCWRGGEHGNRASALSYRRKSTTLATFAPLASFDNVAFVPVSPDCANEAAPIGMTLYPSITNSSDFNDTAALVATLDLIITTDTAVAHLAGALGKPTWVLLHNNAGWPWLANRRDSVWYPNVMKTFRQPARGDWTSVIDEVTLALTDWLGEADRRLS